ncbi:MAG: glutathione S-transferase [Blastopirellula sp.]|nr:MAG: glutathione S-transferase [Blastopirellula sp.]
MIELYDFELSGNCYKLRLLMTILGIEYTPKMIDFFPGNEHQTDEFLEINPLGQLPVLCDGEVTLRDAQAILTYLATKYDESGQWYPVTDPARLGLVNQWLAFADMITSTASAARLHDGLFYHWIDINKARAGAHRLFQVLDEHLWHAEQDGELWILPGNNPTLADLACFPYTMLASEGGVPLTDYPAIRRWTDRFKRVPGFIPMPGIFPAGTA